MERPPRNGVKGPKGNCEVSRCVGPRRVVCCEQERGWLLAGNAVLLKHVIWTMLLH